MRGARELRRRTAGAPVRCKRMAGAPVRWKRTVRTRCNIETKPALGKLLKERRRDHVEIGRRNAQENTRSRQNILLGGATQVRSARDTKVYLPKLEHVASPSLRGHFFGASCHTHTAAKKTPAIHRHAVHVRDTPARDVERAAASRHAEEPCARRFICTACAARRQGRGGFWHGECSPAPWCRICG